jgi:hypothetical protein
MARTRAEYLTKKSWKSSFTNPTAFSPCKLDAYRRENMWRYILRFVATSTTRIFTTMYAVPPKIHQLCEKRLRSQSPAPAVSANSEIRSIDRARRKKAARIRVQVT